MRLLVLSFLVFGWVSVNAQVLWFTNIGPDDVTINLSGRGASWNLESEVGETTVFDFGSGVTPFDVTWSISAPYEASGGFQVSGPGDYVLHYADSEGFSGGITAVPEPSSVCLAGLGFGVLGRFLWRRKIKNNRKVGMTRTVKNNLRYLRRFTAVVAPVGRAFANNVMRAWLVICGIMFTVFASLNAKADTNFPDTSGLISGPQTGFNSALTWTIGAMAVLITIGWIVRAMSKRK
jgi:hypothetical protein